MPSVLRETTCPTKDVVGKALQDELRGRHAFATVALHVLSTVHLVPQAPLSTPPLGAQMVRDTLRRRHGSLKRHTRTLASRQDADTE